MKTCHFIFLLIFCLPVLGFSQSESSDCEALVFSLKEANACSHPEQITGIDLTLKGHAEFPIDLLKFTQLNDVNLSGNGLRELPEDIQKLKSLRYLDLSSNKLKRLPEALWTIKTLRSVNVANNKFSKKEKRKLVAGHADVLNPVDENGHVIWKSDKLIFAK